MQEAYRPPCIEYSFCCPTWVPPPHPDLAGGGGGTLPGPAGGGVPCWGGAYHSWYPLARPGRVPPSQLDLAGYPPPPAGPGRVPQLDLAGYPPPAGPGRVPPRGVCPMAFWEMLQSIMGYGYPPPPPVDRQIDGRTDACQNITFPSRAVKKRVL